MSDFEARRCSCTSIPEPAGTPGCTKQSCGLQDIAEDVGDTAIVGISRDKPEKQAKFDQKYSLGFPLLSD